MMDGVESQTAELAHSPALAMKHIGQALVMCFLIILLGYLAGRTNLVSRPQGKGLGIFVAKFALPALLFRNITMMKLHGGVTLNLQFLFTSLYLGKAIVFLATVLFTFLVVRPVDFGKVGIYGIFVTQGHDFALGLPIVSAIYSDNQELCAALNSYLFLAAPMSAAVCNPIGFLFMEIEKSRHAEGGNGRKLWKTVLIVIKEVVTNPVIFMTALGFAANFAFKENIPCVYLKDILDKFCDAFPVLALFVLGLNNVGIFSGGLKETIVTALLLIAAKMVMTPMVMYSLAMETLESNATLTYEDRDLSMFAFLYGMFPPAPTVFVFASCYNMQPNLIAASMMIATFLFVPLALFSCGIMTLQSQTDMAMAGEILSDISIIVATISAISCIWVWIVFAVNKRFQNIPHQFTTFLILAQLLIAVGGALHHALPLKLDASHIIDKQDCDSELWLHLVEFVPHYIGCLSSTCWMTVLSITLFLLKSRSLRSVIKYRPIMYFFACGIPVLMCAILLITSHNENIEKCKMGHAANNTRFGHLEYGNTQAILTVCILTLNSVITVMTLIMGHHQQLKTLLSLKRHLARPSIQREPASDQLSHNISSHTVLEPPASSITMPINDLYRSRNPPLECPLKRSSSVPARLRLCHTPILSRRRNYGSTTTIISRNLDGREINRHSAVDLDPTNWSHTLEAYEQLDLQSSYEVEVQSGLRDFLYRSSYRSLMDPLEEEEQLLMYEKQNRDEFQDGRHIALILALLISSFVTICLCVWQLLNEQSIPYYEVSFINNIFTYGQGIFTLLIFGVDSKLIFEPVINKWRKIFERREKISVPAWCDLDQETRMICDQFSYYHSQCCQDSIARDIRIYLRMYENVFLGTELIDWLLEVGLAEDRTEGLMYGRHLVDGRVIEHIHQEHHFCDLTYFYHMVNTQNDQIS